MARRRSNQEGSFYQRPDGLWIGRVSVDGKRRQFTGKTRTEAAKKLAQFVREPYELSATSVGEYLQFWLNEICAPKLKPRTLDSYQGIVRLYIEPKLGKVKLSKLGASQILGWRNQLLKSHLSPRTVHHAYSVLRTALGRAVKLGLVPRNVVLLVDPPTVKDVEIEVMTPSQVQALLAAAQGARFDNLFAVLASTGLRLGEAQALRWCDVDLDQGLLRVQHTLYWPARQPWSLAEPKSVRSRRVVPLIGQARQALVAQRDRQVFERQAAGSKYVDADLVFATPFGSPVRSWGVEYDFKKALKAAGLPLSHHPHSLRHGAATFLLASGAAEATVMRFLGHTNIATTRGYSHVLDTMLASAALDLETFMASAV